MRGIEAVHGGPAVGPVADGAGGAPVAGDADEGRHDAVISLAVHRGGPRGRRGRASSARWPSEAGIAVFRIAFERWIDETGWRDLPQLIRDSMDGLKAVTAGADPYPT